MSQEIWDYAYLDVDAQSTNYTRSAIPSITPIVAPSITAPVNSSEHGSSATSQQEHVMANQSGESLIQGDTSRSPHPQLATYGTQKDHFLNLPIAIRKGNRVTHPIECFVSYDPFSITYVSFLVSISYHHEPLNFHEAQKLPEWQKAMKEEIEALESNDIGRLFLYLLARDPLIVNGWVTLVGQFRPKKLISAIKSEVAGGDELEFPGFKNIVKHFWDKSLYSLGLCSQLSLGPVTSLFFGTEGDGAKMGRRSKAMLFHKLSHHDVTMEAAWPELYIDRKGAYWDIPLSISLDLASLVSESGLRYRFGIHKNSGFPRALTSTCGDIPPTLMPGLCAKAAFSYEKSRDIWRQKNKMKEMMVETDKGQILWNSYDTRLREPHAAISGIVGGTCTAWHDGGESMHADTRSQSGEGEHSRDNKRPPFTADLFGSLCYTLQHGQFRKDFLDLTRIDTRLDICSASAFIKGAANLVSGSRNSVPHEANPLTSPRLNVTIQQQVAGPIVFRVDSRFSFNSPSGRHVPHIEDVLYSLSYSLRLLRSGKVVAWYSPRRKEGMIELRLFEF